jgi:hypothetical protein
MTEAEINNLEAGRELDMLIAELVFGRDRLSARVDPMSRDGEPQYHWGYPQGHDFAPAYSTDIWAAWEVVEELKRRKVRTFIEVNPYAPIFRIEMTQPSEEYRAVGETIQVAICRTALMLVRGKAM